MLELCTAIAERKDRVHIRGIIYKENGIFVKTAARPYIENLDEIPHPARQMLNFESYLVPPGIIRGHWSERSTTIMTSRGCPFQCIWCGSQCTFGRKVRYRSVDNVIEEIELLIRDHKINAIWIVDDTFTLSKKRVSEFCDKIFAKNIKIVWGCQAHIKTADLEMFKLMKKAGCIQLDFGVESGSDKVLQELKKDSNSMLIEKAFQIARHADLRTAATFMFGSPGEKEKDVELTFKLAKKIRPDFVSSFFITPYPGTEFMTMVEKNNWEFPLNRHEIGLKKKPALKIYFNEEQLLDIRKRFQKEFAFQNFAGVILSPKFFFKATILALSYPMGLLAGVKKFFKTKVIDDFFFEFLIYYTKQKQLVKKSI
ncbi:MAG: B12-binding domain-containing radical SAM protein [Candidatus Riflebacteria bacterium]|nr:B12-binding domain-containing radical SAM protein [Candidatus Riflebacteria bacterium]